MNYELARKLKDAGFPQEGNGVLRNENGLAPPLFGGFPLEGEYGTFIYCPTPEELIEACGDRDLTFIRRRDYKDWLAHAWILSDNFDKALKGEGELIRAEGKTHPEAVANLWLKLNPKDTK